MTDPVSLQATRGPRALGRACRGLQFCMCAHAHTPREHSQPVAVVYKAFARQGRCVRARMEGRTAHRKTLRSAGTDREFLCPNYEEGQGYRPGEPAQLATPSPAVQSIRSN